MLSKKGNMAETQNATKPCEFACERCGQEATTKGNLIQHLRKKKACLVSKSAREREDIIASLTRMSEKNKQYACNHCSQRFSTPAGKSKHQKVCTVQLEKEMVVRMANMEILIKELQQELQQYKQSGLTIGTNIENQQNNISIVMNNYGQESMTHLTHEFLNHCLLNPSKGLTSLIEKIHYNPELPENHNLRHKSTKQCILQKFINQNWHDCDASNTLDELIKKGYRILNAYYSDHVANDPLIFDDEMTARMYEKFRFLSDKKSLEYNAVKRELRLLVKDKTIYLLAPMGTHINPDEMQEIEKEIEDELI
jgi:hypothetical protein